MRHPLETDASQLQSPLASPSQSFHTNWFYDDKVINNGKVSWGKLGDGEGGMGKFKKLCMSSGLLEWLLEAMESLQAIREGRRSKVQETVRAHLLEEDGRRGMAAAPGEKLQYQDLLVVFSSLFSVHCRHSVWTEEVCVRSSYSEEFRGHDPRQDHVITEHWRILHTQVSLFNNLVQWSEWSFPLPSNSFVGTLTPSVMVSGGGAFGVTGSWGRAFMNGFCALYKRGSRRSSCPFCHPDTREVCSPEEGLHHSTIVLVPWSWTSSLQDCEK